MERQGVRGSIMIARMMEDIGSCRQDKTTMMMMAHADDNNHRHGPGLLFVLFRLKVYRQSNVGVRKVPWLYGSDSAPAHPCFCPSCCTCKLRNLAPQVAKY